MLRKLMQWVGGSATPPSLPASDRPHPAPGAPAPRDVTDADFATVVLAAELPVVVDFWAEWCGPCRAREPAIKEFAGAYAGKVRVGKLNVDDNPSTTMKFMVRGIPTVILFKDGQVVDQIVGLVDKNSLSQMVNKHL